jgi:NAD(P)-dependent dehydrogenase (short-subunit alcohol dehydrogenase family)
MAARLQGKVAIVTGAGSRGPGLGNGKATAILFAREGARVLCVDAVKDRAEETVGLIRGEGGEAEAFAADVTRAVDCRAMVEAAAGRWGGLDILHNNVGIESRGTLMETTEEEWDRVMAVDLKSMLLATQAAVPALERRGGGSVICVSSVAALRGLARTAYAAAKAGVIGFTRSTARELASRGITANVVAPGFIETDMTEGLDAAARDVYLALIPLRRLGKGEDVAAAVTFLAGPGASYITGQVIHVNGGLYV